MKQLQEDLPQEKADNEESPNEKKAALKAIIAAYNREYGTSHRINEFDAYYQDVQDRIKSRRFPNSDVPHKDKIDITIVVDMLLTGFDSQSLNKLYVDKKLRYHGLIQAFSRTNRVLNDTKPAGNILDFRRQQAAVDEAIKIFSGEHEDKAKEIWLVDPAPTFITRLGEAVKRLDDFMTSQGLKCVPEDVPKLKGDIAHAQFIKTFKEVQRLKTQLDQYTDLEPGQKAAIEGIIPIDTHRAFKGVYIDTAREMKKQRDTDGPDIRPELDELDFEFVLFASATISFQDVEPMAYDFVYYHDYHGWRDTLAGATEAFNAFVASGGSQEAIEAVSFYTAQHDVNYTIKIYDRYEGGHLLDELFSQSGNMQYKGFHTVDIVSPLSITLGDDFYVYLYLSAGGQPYDCTSDVPVLLGSSGRIMVNSAASPGENLYYSGGNWVDLTTVDASANFCIKALSSDQPPLSFDYPEALPDGVYPPGLATEMTIEITDGFQNYVPGSGLMHYRFDPNDPYTTVALTSLGNDLFSVVLPNTRPGDAPEFYFSAQGDGGATVYSPVDAPASVYSFEVCFVELLFEDTFETHLAWTTENSNVSTGEWERGDPAGTDAQPENDHSDPGTQCYVTGKAGGGVGDDDLDGGPTRLISPVFDLSGGDALISFYSWFYHTDYGDQHPLAVEIEKGNGVWVDVMDLLHNPAWNLYSFKASDYIELTDSMRVRFTANDNPNDDVVEALIDDFLVERYVYDASLWADGYTISASTRTVIDFSLDAGAANGNRKYLILGTMSGASPGYTLPGGAVLPLNWDTFTDLLLLFLNTPVCQNFYSTLEATGNAVSTLDTFGALDPSVIGETAGFAYLLGAPPSMNYTSNAIAIPFEP